MKEEYVSPGEFYKCRRKAIFELSTLMNNCETINAKWSIDEHKSFFENDRNMNTWCLNLIGVLMMFCGGQRLATLCNLQRPTPKQITECQTDGEHNCYWELHSTMEYNEGTKNVWLVPIPYSLLKIIQFHVAEVLPVLDGKRESLAYATSISDSICSRSLLLHSVNGLCLNPSQVYTNFRSFLIQVNVSLGTVSSLKYRESYAAMLLVGYYRGKILRNQPKEVFLQFLSKATNTSTEQLQETYESFVKEDYNVITNNITEIARKIIAEEGGYNGPGRTTQFADDEGIGKNDFF